MLLKLQELTSQYKLPLILILVGLSLLSIGYVVSFPKSIKPDYPKESLITQPKQVIVDLSGAVNKPGVYTLEEGARVEEVVKKAEGFREDANKEYIARSLNMAQKLIDGSKIYIPFDGEVVQVQVAGVSSSSTNKVSVNLSTQSELEALSGIGPVSASKIIANRPYQTLEELVTKKVITKALLDKLKDTLVY
ncbi:helix-hairpin-helix domain-containing protein [Candidatus Daviesbacteria bacterium]|nr:helix-hairpin-helix domain-containing protein [Candidatus Daviesbacteria bacterium]